MKFQSNKLYPPVGGRVAKGGKEAYVTRLKPPTDSTCTPALFLFTDNIQWMGDVTPGAGLTQIACVWCVQCTEPSRTQMLSNS